ncbi:MAG TPA: tetratricopeptide repeat protein [Blastocatellia bacterium]|nr:tetratricopeptide repeat protein [Blastocatellia bacterium]
MRVISFFVIFIFLSSVASPAQSLPDLPKPVFDNFAPEIREQLRKAYAAAQASPREAEAVGRLCMTLHTYEESEAAAVCYERARRLAPNEFRWAYYLGVVRASSGKHGEASAVFKEAIGLRPDYLPAQLRLADSSLAAGRRPESRPLYEAVIRKNAAIAQAHYGLGRIEAAAGAQAAAVAHFRKALALFPEYGAAHYAAGLALRDLGQADKAQEHLALSQKYKLSRPPLDDPLLNAIAELNALGTEILKRGVMLESAGRIEESIAEHERALEVNPQLTQAHINLIQLYGRTGQFEKAEKHYRAVVAINPNLTDSHYNYGVLLAGQERYADAAQAFYRSLQINQFNAEAHHNYAAMIEREGRLDEAAEHFRKALENKPGHRLAHFHLGRILVHQGKLAEAIEHFHRTLKEEDEQTPRFTYALGATYVRAGEKQKGIQFLREALKRATALGQTQLAASVERDLRQLEAFRD